MPILPLLPVLLVIPSARPAPASNSVLLAPILRPCLSMVSAAIAHTPATLVDQLPQSAPLAFLDSTLLDLPALLLVLLEPALLTEFANALLDTSTPISALLHAPVATVPLEDNALSVLVTVLLALEPVLPAPAV